MMKKILIVICFLLVLGLGYFFLKPVKSYSMDEVATHATPENCWLVIEGNVYDVTKFIPNHPGKQAILMGCGKDATALFNNRPNGSGAHSSTARSLMKQFAIGKIN